MKMIAENERSHDGMDYELNIKSISCNAGGKYEARLELKAPEWSVDFSGVTVERLGEVVDLSVGPPLFKCEVTEENLGEQIPLENGRINFKFPKDILQPEVEIFLLLEVKRYPLNVTSDEVQPHAAAVFTARLLLHPRPPSEEGDGDTPPSSGTLNLTQRLEDESILQLGGKLWYEEKMTPQEDQTGETVEEEDGPARAASPRDTAPRADSPIPLKLGKVVLLVHAASLPKSSKTLQCRPFVKCLVSGQYQSEPTQATPPTQNATLSPLWEHQLIVAVNETALDEATLVLQVTDQLTASTIVEYQLPVSVFQPFHQYHLDMIQSLSEEENVHLFTSIMYQPSELPVVDELNYRALEVNVLPLEGPITNPVGPLTVAAYLSHDWSGKQETMAPLDITPVAVHFPNPPTTVFLNRSRTGPVTRHCQISSPSTSETHPQWSDPFLFADHQDLSSIFTDTAALIIHLMASSSSFDGQAWCLKQQVGCAIQPLDRTVYEALIDPRGRAGVRVHALKFESSTLKHPPSSSLGLNFTLQLIVNENLGSTISSSSPGTLPSLDTFIPSQPERPFRRTDTYLTKPSVPKTPPVAPLPHPESLPIRNGDKRRKWSKADDGPTDALPAYDAMHDILDRMVKPLDQIPTRMPPDDKQERRDSGETPDKFALSLIESQQRELDNYRQALQKMGEEMVALQQNVSRLEGEKSFLQRQLSMHEDAAKALVSAENAEVITKAELLEKYVTLKQALSQQVEETTTYRDKVLTLQNQLIKLNDSEQKQIKLEKQLAAQTDLLHERNGKVKKLESTCQVQETALDKMEKLIKKKLNGRSLGHSKANNSTVDNPLLDSLTVENATLKAQLAQMKVDSAAELTSNDAAEKLMRELQYEKATKRIASLEQEIRDKAKEWGREKTAMRLSVSADRDMNRYRALPPLEHPYDTAHRSDDHYDRGYRSQRPPPFHHHSRHSPLY